MSIEHFKVCGRGGLRERFCLACRALRGWKADQLRRLRMKGVDIDRIHYKLGAIRRKEAA